MKTSKIKIVLFVICLICISIFSLWKFNDKTMKQNGEKLDLVSTLTHLSSSFEYSIKQNNDAQNLIEENHNTNMSVQESRMPVDKIQLQVVQSVQENNYFCVPACLQMVLRYKGIEKSQIELSEEMNTKPVTGTEYVDLARVANKYLFNNETVGPNDIGYHIQTLNRNDTNPEISSTFEKRVRLDISSNDPVFVAIDVNALYPNLSSGNHMIVIIGYALYSGTDNIAYYYYIDPSYVVQDETYGGLKTVTKEKLINAIVVNEEPAYIW